MNQPHNSVTLAALAALIVGLPMPASAQVSGKCVENCDAPSAPPNAANAPATPAPASTPADALVPLMDQFIEFGKESERRRQEHQRQHAIEVQRAVDSIAAERELKERQREAADREKFLREHEAAVGALKPVDAPAAAGAKDGQDFDRYRADNAEYRKVIEQLQACDAPKAQLDWCKLHRPVRGRTELQSYQGRRDEWLGRCGCGDGVAAGVAVSGLKPITLEPEPDFVYRGTGTPFFGQGDKASDLDPAISSRIDSGVAAQPVGGGGIRSGAADRPPPATPAPAAAPGRGAARDKGVAPQGKPVLPAGRQEVTRPKATAMRGAPPATAQPAKTWAIQAIQYRGDFRIVLADGRTLRGQNAANVTLGNDARLVTGPDSRVQLVLPDDTTFTALADSEVVLDEFVYDTDEGFLKILARVTKGTFRWVTGKVARRDLRLGVSQIIGSLRGTSLEARVEADGSGELRVYSGMVELRDPRSSRIIAIGAGQLAQFADSAPGLPRPMTDAELATASH